MPVEIKNITLDSLLNERKAVLVLSNGTIFHGIGFGASTKSIGELVFTTFTAAGYNCALTDPSNHGQLYALTYPLIGNYGVPSWELDEVGIEKWFESSSIKCAGFIVHEACKKPSHYKSTKTLNEFLLEQNIPGIERIDTRELTKILRTEGVQLGLLQVFEQNTPIPSDAELIQEVLNASDPNTRHLAGEVSRKEVQKVCLKETEAIGTVVVVDCGVKNNIIRELTKRKINVILVPYNASYEEIMKFEPDGILISNGPGDPKKCIETIQVAKKIIHNCIPCMGICLGNQIIGLAAGGDTYKMKFGHRGGNKPVIDLRTGKGYITSQNHGYALKTESLYKSGFKPLFTNADDGTNEGIYHPEKPIFAVQFHPEAYPGPEDTTYLFDDFLKNIAFRAFTHPINKDQTLGGRI
jgi:carbamoyl-phosphate synthase small subunit